MARINGVDLPNEKRAEIGLTYIYGIGRTTAAKMCADLNIVDGTRIKDLTEEQISAIRDYIDQNGLMVEGEVVRRQLHRDLVARENADVVHTNLAGDRAENGHTVLQLNAKHGVGQRLSDRTFKFDGVFLLQGNHLSLENDSSIACYYMPKTRPGNSQSLHNFFLTRHDGSAYMTPPDIEHHGPLASWVRITGPSSVMATVFS